MRAHTTLDPVAATTGAVDALLTAIEGNPSTGAVVAYRAALARHGRNLLDAAGPEALAAVLARLRADAPDRAADRERIVLTAWEGLTRGAAA